MLTNKIFIYSKNSLFRLDIYFYNKTHIYLTQFNANLIAINSIVSDCRILLPKETLRFENRRVFKHVKHVSERSPLLKSLRLMLQILKLILRSQYFDGNTICRSSRRDRCIERGNERGDNSRKSRPRLISRIGQMEGRRGREEEEEKTLESHR